MRKLLKMKEQLEEQLASLNRKIEAEQNKEKTIATIKTKAKDLESLLQGVSTIKVYYFEKGNELLITEKSELDHSNYNSNDEITLHYKHFKELHQTLETLDKAIKNHNIINNKLRIKNKKPLLDDYEYNYGNSFFDNTLVLTSSDTIQTDFSEPFVVSLYVKVKISNENTVDLEVQTTISYNHDIKKRYSKTVDNIEFDIKYTDISDYTSRFEELTCTISDVEINNLYNVLKQVKSLAFSNSHIVKLSKFSN